MEITDADSESLLSKNRVAILRGVSPNQTKLSFGVFSLTRVGKELAMALQYEPNNDYFIDVAEMIYDRNKNKVVVAVHNINQINETGIRFDTEALKVFQ